MLELKNIVKNYYAQSGTVHALKGVSVTFRNSEFVSVLGPSGCGKTTLLNIVGGLDRYTSGDLVINGKSTKLYKDRDWDVYRNHRVGFIFQSYNLIPHQTVLQNVELALTIAGIGKEERIKRAKEALDRVGLTEQYHKRPNQLSGGQCQRVAIARALVNDPEILLADEPTGALDTVTSVQIMDLIKEISKERLVIMVTHNPELAEKYSTRIINMLDGVLIGDSNPYEPEEVQKESKQEFKKEVKEKAKMSFWTAFRLSARNLISKKGRTTMVGFAGSIGIIGIALVLAFSAGIKGYVASMQDDMLSGNPITITEQTYDLNVLTDMMDSEQKAELIKEPNRVYINSMVEYFIKTSQVRDSMLIKNDIDKNYVDYVKQMPSEYYSAMVLRYGTNVHNNVFTSIQEKDKTEKTNMSITALTAFYTKLLERTNFEDYAAYVDMFIPEMAQAPSNEEYIRSQYKVHGEIADEKDEIMLVINKESTISDLLLARLGYYTQNEFMNLVEKANDSPSYNEELDKPYFTYEELLSEDKTFTWYPNNVVYQKTALSFNYNAYENAEWANNENAVTMKVVGILQPNENIMYGCLSSGIYYTEALTNHIISVSSSETGGVYEYFNGIDTSSMNYMTMMMRASTKYDVSFTYDSQTGVETESIDLSLANYNALMSMMGGANPDAEEIKEGVIRSLGANPVANSISLYPVDFDNKDLVTNYLKAWNDYEGAITVNGVDIEKKDRQKIEATDTLSLIIDLINTMIDIVSYALIAFTSVSLVVSTVMIGIITYVSVVERIKEIGVIRSLGGRKKDVSYLFNAETFIIGLLAGLIGVIATYLISEVVNLILFPLIGIRRIALLPITDAILMVLLSVGLTLISGLIPAKSASNKDPVIALRTE
ncbi:MAG: ABC transporter ATP-binding protein/permease [Clostridia bacterium]|nr:ABC transporter ATP-binding protein/permease [Clostridia bacterium]